MQLRYGSYRCPANAMSFTTSIRNEHNDLGFITAQTQRVDASGTLHASGQAAVVAACAALERALAVPRQDLIFTQDSGAVALALRNAGSISGVRITEGPNYGNSGGGFEYVNGRTFSFSAEVRYARLAVGAILLNSFSETVSTSGGGPVYGWLRPVNAPPERTVLYTHSPYEGSQSGSAESQFGYWPVPLPVLGAPSENPVIARSFSGDKFTITWAYKFSSVKPLFGFPNRIR